MTKLPGLLASALMLAASTTIGYAGVCSDAIESMLRSIRGLRRIERERRFVPDSFIQLPA